MSGERRGVRIGVFTRALAPSRGRCLACGAVQDESGCRVIRVLTIDPDEAGPYAVAPEHRALRALLLSHAFCADVECHDPELLAAQRAWDAADRRDQQVSP